MEHVLHANKSCQNVFTLYLNKFFESSAQCYEAVATIFLILQVRPGVIQGLRAKKQGSQYSVLGSMTAGL